MTAFRPSLNCLVFLSKCEIFRFLGSDKSVTEPSIEPSEEASRLTFPPLAFLERVSMTSVPGHVRCPIPNRCPGAPQRFGSTHTKRQDLKVCGLEAGRKARILRGALSDTRHMANTLLCFVFLMLKPIQS